MQKDYPSDLLKAIEFHGHFCPGLATGYRVARTALEKLGVQRSEDEELLVIAETDDCALDAIQAVLGCTMGKGNLIYQNFGKKVFTVVSRKLNKAVRIAVRPNLFDRKPSEEKSRAAVFGGQGTAEQEQEVQAKRQERIDKILAMNADELFKVDWVDIPMPEPAKIFKSVICDYCGESVMEPRARLKDGKIACLSCCDEYSRGW